MKRLSKKILLFLATALFGVSAILGITIVGLKSVKAATTITVSSVNRTYLGYSSSTGTDYVVTFGGCGTTDLLSGIAINAEITSSNAADTYASLRSKIKLNGTVLSSHSTASAKFYKAGTDSVRIHCSATFGYAKFEFLSGLTVGTGSLASDVTFYQNTDATFSTVAPDSRINGVYEFSANRSQTHSLGNTIWRAVFISSTVPLTAAANNGGVFAGILFTGTVGGTNYNRAQMVDTDGNALITGLIRQYSGTAIGYNTNY
ncbi:MAG: hypothetical protein IJQ23_03350, partial [Clostridia bacterium]|nr:hypothetical protein [Clostridia bacterium]